MPGPMPKDPSIRQRRNKASSRALLPAERAPIEKAPRLPKHPEGESWHYMAKRWWQDVWQSPMHYEYLRGDLPALFRLVILVDKFWRTQSLSLASEIRLLEREFGLTPLSRRRLEWTVVQAEESKDDYERKRIRQAPIIEGDPREVLD